MRTYNFRFLDQLVLCAYVIGLINLVTKGTFTSLELCMLHLLAYSSKSTTTLLLLLPVIRYDLL